MLLSIDTSVGTSVAVVDHVRGVLSEASSPDTRGHAEIIGELIARALGDAGVSVTDLDGVVAGMGPGPFTGLRVGIAAARAFAFGAGIPVFPLPSHDAVAFGQTDPVLVITDARRREVYWSAYSGSDVHGAPVRIAGPAFDRPDDLPEFPGHRRVEPAEVSAGSLGLLAGTLIAAGLPFAADRAIYLREPDAVAATTVKRVS